MNMRGCSTALVVSEVTAAVIAQPCQGLEKEGNVEMNDGNEKPGFSSSLPAPATYLDVGYRFSRAHCFDPVQVSAFANAAGDDNPIRHDPEMAEKSRYGKPIVSGTHTTALLMGLVASHLSKLCQVVGVKFAVELLRPVFSHEQVTLHWEVTGVQSHPAAGHFLDLIGAVIGSDGIERVSSTGRVLAWSFIWCGSKTGSFE